MTLRYLLDTGTVSGPVARQPNPDLLERLDVDGAACAIAAPVWHELVFGVRRLPDGRRRRGLDAFLQNVVRASFPILPYDEAAAAWHGEERARLEALGRPAPFVDGQIAAIARVRGLVLVTTNEKDFAGFAGLSVENWTVRRRRSKPTAPAPGPPAGRGRG